MTDSARLATYDGRLEKGEPAFPLDESALQVAQEKASKAAHSYEAYDRELISIYLLEAGFEQVSVGTVGKGE